MQDDKFCLNKIAPDWILLDFDDVTEYGGVGTSSLPEKRWKSSGLFPVVGQGEGEIQGWTDSNQYLVDAEKSPVILYGGHTRRVKFLTNKFVPGPNIKLLRPFDFLLPKFFYFYLQALSSSIPNKGYADHFPFIKKSLVPITSKTNQIKIVSKIEELLSEVDAGSKAVKRVEANLKRYRASVLKAACEGKLVPTEAELAKAEGRGYEPASVLLERILKERKMKWENENPGKKYKEPAVPDTSELPDLPEGWTWVRAEQVCDFITKGTTPKAHKMFKVNGEIPFIKVYNLTTSGSLDFSIDPTFVSKETHNGELARSKVYPNDILMNIVGPPLGKVSIVPESHPEWNMNQAVVVYRPFAGLNTSYLSNLLMTDSILRWALKKVKATAGQYNLTLEICRDLPIPLPPTDEQLRITEATAVMESVVRYTENTVSKSFDQLRNLKQSVLKKAYEGRLVPEDPDDEPASVLLEKIKEEKNKRALESKLRKQPIRKTKKKLS